MAVRVLKFLPFAGQCKARLMQQQQTCSLLNEIQKASLPLFAAERMGTLDLSWDWGSHASRATYAGGADSMTLDDSQATVDSINARFSEAREEIEIAQDDQDTTYFNESHAEAKKAVDSALAMYTHLLSQLDAGEAAKLQRSMGLKMEQLKAELQQLDTLHD